MKQRYEDNQARRAAALTEEARRRRLARLRLRELRRAQARQQAAFSVMTLGDMARFLNDAQAEVQAIVAKAPVVSVLTAHEVEVIRERVLGPRVEASGDVTAAREHHARVQGVVQAALGRVGERQA